MICPHCGYDLVEYENFQTKSPFTCPACGTPLLLNYEEDIDPETGDDIPMWSWGAVE